MTAHHARRVVLASILALALCASPRTQDRGPQDPVQGQQDQRRPAATIVREFRNTHLPGRSNDNSPEAVQEFRDAIARACQRQADLALELYRSWPDHAELPEMLNKRWAGMNNALGKASDVFAETLKVMKTETNPAILRQAVLAATRSALLLDEVSTKAKIEIAETACEIAPDDERGPLALVNIAKYHASDVAQMRKLCNRVLKDWGKTRWAGGAARGVVKQLQHIGQTPRFTATDIVSQKPIDTHSWLGHPWVLMLWGGFHGNTSKALEQIKTHRAKHPLHVLGLYTWQYKGGRTKLRTDLATHHYDWPQLYTYQPGSTPWKGEWGTGETPLFFLIDAHGKVVTLSYRFKNIQNALRGLEGTGSKQGAGKRKRRKV